MGLADAHPPSDGGILEDLDAAQKLALLACCGTLEIPDLPLQSNRCRQGMSEDAPSTGADCFCCGATDMTQNGPVPCR